MQFKLFTLQEANECIPHVVGLIGEVNHRRQDLVCLLVELDGLRSHQGQGEPDRDLQQRIEGKMAQVTGVRKSLQELNGRIHEMGCVVRDYERGLVDFPTIVQGLPGYLCWHLGEAEVGYWHGPEDGFSGRRPLDGVSRREGR